MTQIESPFAGLKDADYNQYVCPYGCVDAKIQTRGTSSTAVGYFGGPENDGNHHTTSCACGTCHKEFERHYVVRKKGAWYTSGKKVLLGRPVCCSTIYTLPCPSCAGSMQHSTGSDFGISWSTKEGVSVPNQPWFWSCIDCGAVAPDDTHGRKYIDFPFTRTPISTLKRNIDSEKIEGLVVEAEGDSLTATLNDQQRRVTWTRERGFTITEPTVVQVGHRCYTLGKEIIQQLGGKTRY